VASPVPAPPIVEAFPLTSTSSLKTTLSIPGGLGFTKKAGDPQGVPSEPQVVQEEAPTPYIPSPTAPLLLTQALLEEVIFSIREEFRAANKNMELAILDQALRVTDGELTLGVHGSIQEDIANKMKPELLGMLRKLSGATQLSIAVIQQEEDPNEKGKLYTSTDKLKFLREKHPALMELQRKFDLEVDF
jgi:hypothetical protein